MDEKNEIKMLKAYVNNFKLDTPIYVRGIAIKNILDELTKEELFKIIQMAQEAGLIMGINRERNKQNGREE